MLLFALVNWLDCVLTGSPMNSNRGRNSNPEDHSTFAECAEDVLENVPAEAAEKLAARAERIGISSVEYLLFLAAKDCILNGNHPLS